MPAWSVGLSPKPKTPKAGEATAAGRGRGRKGGKSGRQPRGGKGAAEVAEASAASATEGHDESASGKDSVGSALGADGSVADVKFSEIKDKIVGGAQFELVMKKSRLDFDFKYQLGGKDKSLKVPLTIHCLVLKDEISKLFKTKDGQVYTITRSVDSDLFPKKDSTFESDLPTQLPLQEKKREVRKIEGVPEGWSHCAHMYR